jgi:CheY-like chemotaxis protein
MPVLARTSREAFRCGEPDARARLWPFDEAVEAWVDGRTTGCVRPRDRVLRVLVVDDDRDAADSSFALVSLWGHDVRVAYAGVAALAMAGADPPDVLLLDIAMPGMDGLGLARQLRGRTSFRDTLLVAITGYADEAHYRLCAGAFDYYLIKPVEPTTLQKLLMKERELRAWSPADTGGANRTEWDDEPARRRLRAHPQAPRPATTRPFRNGDHGSGRSFAGRAQPLPTEA